MIHGRHRRRVPLGKICVEYRCLIEHVSHVRHLRSVPLGNVRVECICLIEHSIHVRHRRRVPLGKVRVECRCTQERCQSIVHAVVVPIQNKEVEEEQRKKKWVRKQKSMKDTKRSGVDVLLCMLVTAAVSHLERSELNTDAR